MNKNHLNKKIVTLVKKAKEASLELALVSTAEKNKVLTKMAKALLSQIPYLEKANKKDLNFFKHQGLASAPACHLSGRKPYRFRYGAAGYAASLIDRLTLNKNRIQGMAACLLETATLKDPVGEVIRTFQRPNGLIIKKVRTPIGVVGIIYESRPNVTSDCIGLCLKSGNAVILKGGKEAFHSNKAIFNILQQVLKTTRLPHEAIQIIDSTNREAVHILLAQDRHVDLIVPRGGEGLIRFVAEHSRIPVVKHDKGVCHSFVSDKADLLKARQICFNAKVQRPGVCNAMETMLVHQRIAKKFLPIIIEDLQKAGVEIRGCPRTYQILNHLNFKINKASKEDWSEEYLDLILSVKVVENLQEAIEHINMYGSNHSDAIITEDKAQANAFLKSIDSACVYVNASTRFTDGYEFGFGAEIGISTNKLHARGPMALEELTTYKYEILGTGQIRE